MLFLINKTRHDVFDRIRLFGGDDDKSVLLVGDGAFYASAAGKESFDALDVDDVFVAADALEERGVELAGGVEVVDYERMVELILEDGEKVLTV